MGHFIDGIGPGTWPDWVAAVGTTAAFLIAAVSFAVSVRDKRKTQASLVYAQSEISWAKGGETVNQFEGVAYAKTIGFWESLDGLGGDQVAMVEVVLATVSLHNESDGIISNAEVELISPEDYPLPEKYRYNFGTVSPRSKVVFMIAFPHATAPGSDLLTPRLRFTDAVGRKWVRDFAEPIQKMRKDTRVFWPVPDVTLINYKPGYKPQA